MNMEKHILFVGGSGVVGSRAVKLFRQGHTDVPLLVGGRNRAKADSLAHEVGKAEAIEVDINKPDLGVSNDVALAAVVMMVPDEGLRGLMLAQARGIPYLSIGNWLVEVGAEMGHFIHQPRASAVLQASHWHGGTAVALTQATIKGLDEVHSVKVGAIVDEHDATGPAALADMARGSDSTSTLAFEGGHRVWLTGPSRRRMFTAIDGREIHGMAFAPYDLVSLHALTNASDIRFDFASAVSSSRLRGGDIATELIVEVEGYVQGQLQTRRATLEFAKGQATLTATSVVLVLSRVLGLDGAPPLSAGLYFPEQVLDAEWFLDALTRRSATILHSAS